MMKKSVAIVAIAGALTACNNGTDSDATTGDSTSLTTPSTVDSTNSNHTDGFFCSSADGRHHNRWHQRGQLQHHWFGQYVC